MDCVFMAILMILIVNENKKTAKANIKIDFENPIKAKAILKKTKEMIIGFRLSNFETNHPEIGKPNNELIGKINNILPSSASLRSKSDLIVGIRDAHVAKLNPEIKKNMLKAIRCFWFSFIYFSLKMQKSTINFDCRNIS